MYIKSIYRCDTIRFASLYNFTILTYNVDLCIFEYITVEKCTLANILDPLCATIRNRRKCNKVDIFKVLEYKVRIFYRTIYVKTYGCQLAKLVKVLER